MSALVLLMRNDNPRDLGYQIYRSLSHRRSPNTEPSSFADAVAWFVRAASGNISAAARLAGVSRRSMRDYVAGGGATPERRRSLIRSALGSERRARLSSRRESRLRDPGSLVNATLVGHYNYDVEQRGASGDRRPVQIGRYLADDAGEQLADAFLDGVGVEGMRELFASLCTEDATGFFERTMALPPSDPHGWTVTSVTL